MGVCVAPVYAHCCLHSVEKITKIHSTLQQAL